MQVSGKNESVLMEILILFMALSKMSIIIIIKITKEIIRLTVFWTQDVIQFGTEMCHKCYFFGR